MFDYDKWQEILHTIRKNKLRTALTMFGVFWGIFMLLVLLGSGAGLKNGVNRDFSGTAKNSIFMWTQRTTMSYKGFKPGKWFRYNNQDREALLENISEIEYLAARNQLGGWRGANNVSRGSKTAAFDVYGDYPDFQYIQYRKYPKGRFIDELDIKEKRKVVVIGKTAVDVLFEKGEDPIGEYIRINGVFFQVIGVFESFASGENKMQEESSLNVPFSTFQTAFNYGDNIGWFSMTPVEGVSAEVLEDKARALLMERHSIHPEDVSAVGAFNLGKEYQKIQGLFTGINIFIWIVGIGTLLAGVIGVSNIMLIVVKERTKEIGIRKSIGAGSWSIISLILQESIVLTAFAGYIGLLLGTGLIELISVLIAGEDTGMFANPEINFEVALWSLGILIFFGALAGWIPARKAASVSPIEALRTE
jgi:putative ABC transport system permease protein